MTSEIKKHHLVLRLFFHNRAHNRALFGGRVAVKKHPREGGSLEGLLEGLLEGFLVAHETHAHEISAYAARLMRKAYVERLIFGKPGEQA